MRSDLALGDFFLDISHSPRISSLYIERDMPMAKNRETIKTLAKMVYHGKNYTAAQKAAEEKRKKKERERREREALKKKGSVLGQTRTNQLYKEAGTEEDILKKTFGRK